LSKKQKKESKKKPANIALKYSGMAFEMLAIIAVFTFIGKWIDDKYQLDPPIATVIFALLAVVVALYLTLKDLMK